VAPCQYSQAIWAVVFGIAFFAEVPDPFTIAGTGLVVVSGLITLMREKALGVPIPAPPDGRER
jgi:S-adenosylmethionine uptake transporter